MRKRNLKKTLILQTKKTLNQEMKKMNKAAKLNNNKIFLLIFIFLRTNILSGANKFFFT